MPPGYFYLRPWILYKATTCHHLSKEETKNRLLLIATIAKILHQKSNTFEDKKLSDQLAKIYMDLNNMVADF